MPYPHSSAPSQRFRFEQYFNNLRQQGVRIQIQSFLNQETWKILYGPGKTTEKAWGIVKGFLRRFSIFLTLNQYDFIFIHREACPIGPPIFEWLIAKVFRKKIIYDFDDAIWIPNTSEQNKIAASIKWHSKVSSICKWSYKISAGNAYLADYARQFNPNVVINPTTIDTENVHNIIKSHSEPYSSHLQRGSSQLPSLNKEGAGVVTSSSLETTPVIGWTGSHSTLPYLNEIISVLQKLENQYKFEFQVIANKDPNLPLKSFKFVKWQKETEIEDLAKFDIGLMPLTEDKWAKGKCGFKALQYMALGIPPLVSPVGVNTEIVRHGENGFICSGPEDWSNYIDLVIKNPQLRKLIGMKARKTVEDRYSVKSNTENFLGLFR